MGALEGRVRGEEGRVQSSMVGDCGGRTRGYEYLKIFGSVYRVSHPHQETVPPK